jgi:uncharacterized protein YodC (DUF2158 family)
MRDARRHPPTSRQIPAPTPKPAHAIGDIVQLRSGGLSMTVTAIEEGGRIEVTYAGYGSLDSRLLPSEALDCVNPAIPF